MEYFTEKEGKPENAQANYVYCEKCDSLTDYWFTKMCCKNEYTYFFCKNPKCGFYKKMWCEFDGSMINEHY